MLTANRDRGMPQIEQQPVNDNYANGDNVQPSVTVDSGLSPAQQRYELTVLRLISEPEFTFNHPNAAGAIRLELGMGHKDWNNVITRLGKMGVVSLIKDSSVATRSTRGVVLHPDGLVEHSDEPFVSDRVLDGLKATLKPEDQGKLQKIDRAPKVTARRTARGAGKSIRPKEARTPRSATPIIKPNRSAHRNVANMNFFFVSHGKRVSLAIGGREFAKLDPLHKLLFAVGFAATFSTSSDQQKEYVTRLLNKELKKSLRNEEIEAIIEQAAEKEYISSNGHGIELLEKSEQVFEQYR